MKSGDPIPCVFPFIYEERIYSFCTKDGSSKGTPWCATTSNYNLDGKWKYCTLQEHGGSSGGQPCFFPFIYKNRTFYTCTNEDMEDGQLWCATTDSYDRDRRWSYCADIMLSSNPTGPCIFPFTYKGQTYTSCTTDGVFKGLPWCSLSSNYEQDPKWTYCQASVSGTNSGNLPCAFPFKYKDKLYHGCTDTDSQDGKYWCSSTSNYNNQWHYCSTTAPSHSSEKPCVFPFTYEGQQFSECTSLNESNGKLWCSTTDNYDRDPPSHSSEKPCVFPFTYEGQQFSECTSLNESNGKLWCSTTDNYDRDRKWSFCPV
nr:PREDICTED: epididymal sperm-binding protein 1-like [Apteryx mantelli mantelli]